MSSGQPRAGRRGPAPSALHYGVSLVVVGIVLALKLWQSALIGQPTPFLGMIAAVALASWYGGFGPGVMAAVVAAVASDYYFIAPVQGLLASPADALRLALYAGEGLLVSFVCSSLRAGRDQLEIRVEERTAALTEANQQLRVEIEERQRIAEELRQSEGRYRSLLDTANEGIWTLDAGMSVNYANLRMSELLDYPTPEMLGRPIFDFLFEEDHADYARRFQERRSGVREQYDFRLRRRDGSELWLLVCGSPIADDAGGFAGVLAMFTDVTERKRAEDAVRASAERLHYLSQRLLKVQETERRHIARELHDELGQSLTALKINLQTSRLYGDANQLAARVDDSVSLVERMLEQVRSLSLNLRPTLLDELGLVPALGWYLERQAERAGTPIEFQADPLPPRLPWELETVCFRVAQEALTNVLRHAEAQRVSCELRRSEGQLELRVADDGAGFDVEAARQRAAQGANLGLLGMEERVLLAGGRIEIHSAPGKGTEIRARLPLPQEEGV